MVGSFRGYTPSAPLLEHRLRAVMNKAEFVAEVARKASITREEAARAVDAVFDVGSEGIFAALPAEVRDNVIRAGSLTDKHSGYVTFDVKWKGSELSHAFFEEAKHAVSNTSADEDRPETVQRIRDLARKVWENSADAEEFLTTPHGLLDGKTPLALAHTAEGAERVREILLALEYGLPV
jgi:uncharacterized protein (DUF2384 family)